MLVSCRILGQELKADKRNGLVNSGRAQCAICPMNTRVEDAYREIAAFQKATQWIETPCDRNHRGQNMQPPPDFTGEQRTCPQHKWLCSKESSKDLTSLSHS